MTMRRCYVFKVCKQMKNAHARVGLKVSGVGSQTLGPHSVEFQVTNKRRCIHFASYEGQFITFRILNSARTKISLIG